MQLYKHFFHEWKWIDWNTSADFIHATPLKKNRETRGFNLGNKVEISWEWLHIALISRASTIRELKNH